AFPLPRNSSRTGRVCAAAPSGRRSSRPGRRARFSFGGARSRGHAGFPARAASLLGAGDRKSTRLNSSHVKISYAVFCLRKQLRFVNPQLCATLGSPSALLLGSRLERTCLSGLDTLLA